MSELVWGIKHILFCTGIKYWFWCNVKIFLAFSIFWFLVHLKWCLWSDVVHCQLAYDAKEAVKLIPVSVFYNEQHALDSPQPVVGQQCMSAFIYLSTLKYVLVFLALLLYLGCLDRSAEGIMFLGGHGVCLWFCTSFFHSVLKLPRYEQ